MAESETGAGAVGGSAPGENVYELGMLRVGRARPRGPRPRQATVAAILLGLFGLLGVFVAWLLVAALKDDTDHGETVNGALYALAYLQFALSGAQIVSGLLVWQGRAWARILAIVLCSVNLLGGVLSLASGGAFQAITALALNIGLIRMLTRPDVADWCR
jgi:hypothetical protein